MGNADVAPVEHIAHRNGTGKDGGIVNVERLVTIDPRQSNEAQGHDRRRFMTMPDSPGGVLPYIETVFISLRPRIRHPSVEAEVVVKAQLQDNPFTPVQDLA